MGKKIYNLQKPTLSLVNRYLKKFESDDRYYIADQAIIDLFSTYPKNTKLKEVLLKVSILNDMYSTNIYATYEMAMHIQKLSIDQRLKKSDENVVHEIAKLKIKGKTRNHYSFATKYCSWHKQNEYPIYDTFVDSILWEYKKQYAYADYKRSDLRDYKQFKQVVSSFREYFNLQDLDFKQIDKFLWIYGKQVFAKKN